MGEQLNLQTYLLIALLIWLLGLSIYIIKVVSHYKKLTRGTNNLSLEKVLENIIEKQGQEAKYIQELSVNLARLEKQAQDHYQKVSLIRFNPFEDAGGDQSFVIAMLDGHDNGFVISSLHSRNGTRVYAKVVSSGKSAAHAFTKEEKETIEKALKKKIS